MSRGRRAVTRTDHRAAVRRVRSEAAMAERTRIAGILSCQEARGREDIANHLAFKTSASVDDAKGILAHSGIAPADRGPIPEIARRTSAAPVQISTVPAAPGAETADGAAAPVLALIRMARLPGFKSGEVEP